MVTKNYRLVEIAPALAARHAVACLADYVAQIPSRVDPAEGWAISSPDEIDEASALETTIGQTMALLTEWAKRGQNVDGWDLDRARGAVDEIRAALYSCPGDPGVVHADVLEKNEHSDDADVVGVVLLAALGRFAIADKAPIQDRELAALASVTRPRISQLVGMDELRRAPSGGITCASAKKWLKSRELPGI